MTHATSWNRQATGEAPSSGGATAGVRPEPLGRRPSSRGGGEFGLPLVAGVPAHGAAGPRQQAHAGPTPATVHRAETPTRDVAGSGCAPSRVSDRALDSGSRDRVDRSRVRRAVPPRPCLEGADGPGLELPETRAARPRAGRGRHRPLEAGRMAADKKTPLDVAPISSSSMRAGSSSFPTSAGPGRPRARPPASAIATGTIASRSVAPWPSRPSGGAWRSISGVGREISAASTFAPFSSTCCAISAAPSFCSGIAAPSIGAAKSGRSWPTIHGSMSMTSPLTPRSSTRPSMCGPRRTMDLPMEPPTIFGSSAISWRARRAGCVVPRAFCGPASTRRISRGPGETFHYLCRTQ